MQLDYSYVKIYTDKFQITGRIAVEVPQYAASRFSDCFNLERRPFIPVEEAKIYSLESKELVDESAFMMVRRGDINLIIPIKEPSSTAKKKYDTIDEALDSLEK